MGNIWRQPADVLTGKSGTKIIYIERYVYEASENANGNLCIVML